MQAQGKPVLLPDNPAPHVTDWLLEIGPSVSGAMGEAAIGWHDLAAWERLTGIELEPWEARTIVRLSHAFLGERYKAKKPDCPPPYIGDREAIVSERENVSHRVKQAFKGLVGKKG